VQPDESFFTHIHTEKAMANVTVSPGRAGPVVITIQLETADELTLEAKSVSVTLTNPGTASQVAQAERTDDNQWQARMSAPSPGRWMLGLGISISDTDRVDIESPIMIR
jgi:copper transport protein